jgi:hypothetical protein
MFPLCRTCADNLQQEPCHHSDAERTLHGTWVTLELEKALEKGYKLVRIDEVWHFPEHTEWTVQGLYWCLPQNQARGKVLALSSHVRYYYPSHHQCLRFLLFPSLFLASCFPPECDTDEKKGQYIVDYAAKEGIQLNPR